MTSSARPPPAEPGVSSGVLCCTLGRGAGLGFLGLRTPSNGALAGGQHLRVPQRFHTLGPRSLSKLLKPLPEQLPSAMAQNRKDGAFSAMGTSRHAANQPPGFCWARESKDRVCKMLRILLGLLCILKDSLQNEFRSYVPL